MKCKIQWIDANGKATPDENEAVEMAHYHDSTIEVTDMSRGKTRTIYHETIRQSFPICAEHMAMVEYNWRYGSGGGWSFSPLPTSEVDWQLEEEHR